MRRTISFLLIILFGFLLIPLNVNDQVNDRLKATQRRTDEIKLKQSLLKQDIERTDVLCRTQCTTDFKEALKGLQRQDQSSIAASLQQLRTEHPHMDQLIWTDTGTALEKGVASGTLPDSIKLAAKRYIDIAKQHVDHGKLYQSPPIRQADSVYYVLGMPSSDANDSLIGLIHQEILRHVELEQRKNLRIVPYPSDQRFNIESVDSDSLRDVKVYDPEDNEGASHYHDRQVVVKFTFEPTARQLAQIKAEINATTVKKLGYTYVFESKLMTAKQLMQYFKKWKIDYAEPHFLYLTNELFPIRNNDDVEAEAFVPNDVLYTKYQWNLPMIETNLGWKVTKGSDDIVVAVIDTGVDLNHPDLNPHLTEGVNIVNDQLPPDDDVGHGTHVAGVIAALVNNVEGVAGMTWYNRVMPVKVLDQTGAGNTYGVAQGIIWAADHGAKVINMSLGNYADAQFLHDAVKYAYDRDIVIIAATGNDNTEQPGFPAAYPEVFAVSATDEHRQRAPFSNYGDYIDVMAPGVSIASTYPDNQYAALSGTSMASPHVAALAALIRSANPLLKNTEVMDIMRQTSQDLGANGKDKYFGYGQIDVVKALHNAEHSAHSLILWSQWLGREIGRIKRKYGAQ